MQNVFIDFETAYDKGYSLTSMPTCLYVRDDRFTVFGVSIGIDDGPVHWYPLEAAAPALHAIDWANSRLVAHNAMFEGTILNERYDIQPAAYCDTAGLARAFLPSGIRADLDSACKAFGLGSKIEGTLASVKGVFEPTQEQLDALGIYCVNDSEMCRALFNLLWPELPEQERYVLSMTVRMSSAAMFELDQDVLRHEIELTKRTRNATIKAGETDFAVLSSNQQFAAALTKLTGSCPTKHNKKNEEIPALGKNDAEYVRFKLDHPDLAPLFEAREAAKSTIMLRRPETYLRIAETGRMPMPYRYWGAHTGRFSGADGLNVQNLPNLHRSSLRTAFTAPEGCVVHVADSAQIELRVQLWLSGDMKLLTRLANDEDIYSEQATKIYHRPVTKANKLERGVGKALELMAQYGAGGPRYRSYLAGGPLGLPPIFISEDEAQRSIHTVYRAAHKPTVKMWEFLDGALQEMCEPHTEREFKGLTFLHERVLLPNGMYLDYTGLRHTEDGGLVYGVHGAAKNIWGGTFLENLCQALARIIVTDQSVEIDKNIAPVVGQTHDENLAIGPAKTAAADHAAMLEVMSRSPSWAPDLPLAAEGGWDRCYSK